MAFDAVILAGGEARRLGGADKPGLTVGGRSLVEHVVTAVADARTTIVVGPERPIPGVVFVREDPPRSGPVPALTAGLNEVTAPWVVLLAGDLPFITAPHVTALLNAATNHPPTSPAGPPAPQTHAEAAEPAPLNAADPAPATATGEKPTPQTDTAATRPTAGNAARPTAGATARPVSGNVVIPTPGDVVEAAPGGVARSASEGAAGPSMPSQAPWPVSQDAAGTAAGSAVPSAAGDARQRASEKGTVGGVVMVDDGGREQWLAGVWPTARLKRALAAYQGRSLKGLLGPLTAVRLALPGRPWFDCDTMDDLEEARMNVLNEWTALACKELGIDPATVDRDLILDLTKEVAHGVARPAAPLTAYLLGLAQGAGTAPDDAVAKLITLAKNWGQATAETLTDS
ncbi:NTP transferase domain-containing protein [Nonomuraea sp. NPDC050451]|uniref:NTP transferase domain-containing protein n=1 Tax=Nonomuraea sp. NPDC050451 TaxID=3364364 RepID=UPI0037A4188B